jgi:hypothetical protein
MHGKYQGQHIVELGAKRQLNMRDDQETVYLIERL